MNARYEQSRGGYTHFHIGRRDADFQILVQETDRFRRILILPDALLRRDIWVPIEGYRRIENQPPAVDWLEFLDAWHLLKVSAGRAARRKR